MTFFTSQLKEKLCVQSFHCRKIIEKILKPVTYGEVVEQGLRFHPGSPERQGATEDPGI